jgi:HK97 family phage portal protein
MGWLDALETRSIENPKTPLSALYVDSAGSTAGVAISPENALEVSAVWAAIRRISSTLATLPLQVYKITPDGKDKAREHPNWKLLHDRPNPEMSSFVWRETLTGHLLLYGNAYCEIERNASAEPIALWPIHPTKIRFERRGTEKVYFVRVDAQEIPLSTDAILHIPGFSLDGCSGVLPMHLMRNTIGLAKATETYGAKFFANGAAPSGVISHPNSLNADGAERLRKSWNAAHGGLTNAQRVAILEEGMTWSPLGVPPEHAQFLETRKFQVSEIARLFLIPPHLIADLENATFSNIEQQSIEYAVHCIEPWTRRIEQELNYKLFGTPDYFCEFNLSGLMRGDSTSRANRYRTLYSVGAISANEIRALENMNRREGADELFRPLNMDPLTGPSTDTKEDQ